MPERTEWQLVPKKPTEKMIAGGQAVLWKGPAQSEPGTVRITTSSFIDIYRAMLAAAPSPEARKAGVEEIAARTEAEKVGPIYVASRASIPARSEMWRNLRDSYGWQITSTWIDEAGEGQTADFTELWDRITREIEASRKVVLYAKADDFPLKGAILEAGIALGMGKPVVVCLPGVELEGRTFRPLGSWIKHRNVIRIDSLHNAMAYRAAALPPPAPAEWWRPKSIAEAQDMIGKCNLYLSINGLGDPAKCVTVPPPPTKGGDACNCGAAVDGRWAGVHDPSCPTIKPTMAELLANPPCKNESPYVSADGSCMRCRADQGETCRLPPPPTRGGTK